MHIETGTSSTVMLLFQLTSTTTQHIILQQQQRKNDKYKTMFWFLSTTFIVYKKGLVANTRKRGVGRVCHFWKHSLDGLYKNSINLMNLNCVYLNYITTDFFMAYIYNNYIIIINQNIFTFYLGLKIFTSSKQNSHFKFLRYEKILYGF